MAKERPTLDPVESRYKAALGLLMRLRGINDRQVGERVGMSQQLVQQRRDGWTRIRPGEISAFAQVLRVPEELFTMDGADIHRWWAAHYDRVEAETIFSAAA